jgi:CheY-like chemotaxis protein
VPAAEGVGVTGKKILLVYDVDFFLEVEKEFLAATRAQILTASNGQEALAAAHRERPDLIFMDVTMPIMNGLTCCRALKADPRLRDIPVVMVFAPSPDTTVETCRNAGCDGVLTKPLNRESFLSVGRSFLQQIDRREPRVPCRTRVTVRRSGVEIPAMSEDLGPSGMYIACQEEVALNDTLQLLIHLPEEAAPVEIRGKISWLNQGADRQKRYLPPGFGVKFLQAGSASRTLISDLVRRLSPSTKI